MIPIVTHIVDAIVDIPNSIFSDAFHRECLTTASLPISKNCCCKKNEIADKAIRESGDIRVCLRLSYR